MKFKLVTVLTALFTFSGCTAIINSMIPTASAPQLRTNVLVEEDHFSKVINLNGVESPDFVESNGYTGGGHHLRTNINSTNKTITFHQLYVMHQYGPSDWKFYRSASGEDGQFLEFTPISQKVGYCFNSGCIKTESFGITIPDSTLRKFSQSGYKIKVYSKSGSDPVVSITSLQILSQLMTVDSILKTR